MVSTPAYNNTNVYIDFNPQIFLTFTLLYNVHECYVESWSLMAGKKGWKLQYRLQSKYKDRIISFLCEFTRDFINPILNFDHLCMFNFSILLSFGSQKWSFKSYTLKHGGSTQPSVALWTPEFRSTFFVYGGTCGTYFLHCINQCLLWIESSLLGFVMHGSYLPCIAVCGRGTLPTSCIRSLINVSLIVSAMILNDKGYDW